MLKRQQTLKQIANTEPKKAPQPKELREVAIQDIGDLLIWIGIATERNVKELVTKHVESDMLSIIKRQYIGIEETQKAMSKLITVHSALLANEKYINNSLSKIYSKVKQLEEIERIKNKGGRKPNKKLYEVADAECKIWYLRTGKVPTSGELSKKMEVVMNEKNGSGRPDGILYLPTRTAREFLKDWQAPNTKFNRQKLVKSFANKD
jgi:hypothetical protein